MKAKPMKAKPMKAKPVKAAVKKTTTKKSTEKTKLIQTKSTDAVLVTDNNYLEAILKLLDSAKSEIDIIAFSFAIGSAAGVLAEKSAPYVIAEKLVQLKKRYKSKIRIRLYIEGHRETTDRNRVTANYLKKAGVLIKYGATHAKGFLVDGRYVLFGSTNLTNQSITKNNETNLLLDDAAAIKGFEKYFNHLWTGGKHGGIKLQPPMFADGDFKDVLIELIDSAKKQLEFSIYFFHHTEIEQAFVRADERGVKIRGFIHDHGAFALSYVRRTKATAERLRAEGIKDLHYGPKNIFTHSKYIIQDQKKILLGTGNWLHEDVKVHPQLYILLQNPKVAAQLSKHLKMQIFKLKTNS